MSVRTLAETIVILYMAIKHSMQLFARIYKN